MSPVPGTQASSMKASILRLSLVVLGLSLFFVNAAQADTWSAGAVVTYNQADWGDPTSAAGMLMSDKFDSVYPSDLFFIGSTSTGYFMLFTNEANLDDFLPALGTPGPLDGDLVNPSSSSAGVFGGEVAALKLNLDFSNAGLIPNSSGLLLGNLVLTGLSGQDSPLNGLTIAQFLPLSEAALSGQATSIGLTDIDNITANINDAFDEGQVDSFAQNHLIAPGSSAAMPEPSTLMLLVIGMFTISFVARKRVLA